MKNKVLFLMPAFNPNPDDFKATLASMLSQSDVADILVVDDGSKIPVESYVSFCSPEVRFLRLSKNSGIVAALNEGINYAMENKYEYVARMDCGDICFKDRIKLQFSYMAKHPDVDILGGVARVVDPQGGFLFFEGVYDSRRLARKLYDNPPFKHPTFMIRTSSLEKFGVYSFEYPDAEDYEILRRFGLLGRLECLPDVLIDYVKDPAGISYVRRGRQLRSKLRIQIKYFVFSNLRSYLSILRTLLTIAIPLKVWERISRFYWGRK